MNGDLNNQQPGMMPTQPMAPQQPGMVPTPPAAPTPAQPAPAPVAPAQPAPVAPAAPVAPQAPMMAAQPVQPPMPPQPPMGQPMGQPVAPAPAPQEPKKKSNILFVIIILLMVAILVFLGKFMLDGEKKNDGPKDNKTTTTTVTTTTTTTTTKPVSKQKSVTCTLHQDMSSQGYTLDGAYTIYYTDGVVDKAHTVETVNSSSVDILNYFDTNVKTTYNQLNQSYGGYTYRTTINGNKFEAVTDIDYSVMNVNAYANDNPSIKPYIKNGKMTVELVLSSYRQMGASCPTTV